MDSFLEAVGVALMVVITLVLFFALTLLFTPAGWIGMGLVYLLFVRGI